MTMMIITRRIQIMIVSMQSSSSCRRRCSSAAALLLLSKQHNNNNKLKRTTAGISTTTTTTTIGHYYYYHKAVFSSSSPNVSPCENGSGRDCDAWTVLAALEKSKEATNVQVAHLVSSLGYLLPQPSGEGGGTTAAPAAATTGFSSHEQHTIPRPTRSSDPAFFSLQLPPPPASSPAESTFAVDQQQSFQWNKDHVLELLQATLRGRRIDLTTIEVLLQAATNHFRSNVPPVVVKLPKLTSAAKEEVTVVGDLHGSLTDLNAVLGLMGSDPSPTHHVVFNGDLADRGDHGIEVIAIVCALTLAFPRYVHINRGNHEDLALSIAYGLSTEIQHKYGTNAFRDGGLNTLLDDFFRSLPLCTIIENDSIIVHGGPPILPKGIDTLEQMQQQFLESSSSSLPSRTSRTADQLQQQQQQSTGSTSSSSQQQQEETIDILIESCLWSDPDIDEQDGTLIANNHNNNNPNDNHEQHHQQLKPNLSRGAGFKFDATTVKNFLQKEGLFRLIRSHEPVHKGCARYVVVDDTDADNDDDDSPKEQRHQQEMELFTVFSASHYPYKQGFNAGAILKLQPNGKHKILRYATEEDEPILSVVAAEKDDDSSSLDDAAAADAAGLTTTSIPHRTIRRALREAIAPHRIELERSYKNAGTNISYEESIDILIQTLNLQGEGLRQPGPMLALAKALLMEEKEEEEDGKSMDLIEMTIPKRLDILGALDAWTTNKVEDQETSDDVDVHPPSVPSGFLKAIFAMVDSNHDDEIDQIEWYTAVSTINSSLPAEATKIDPEVTWKLLDRNGDGKISSSEWQTLATITCR